MEHMCPPSVDPHTTCSQRSRDDRGQRQEVLGVGKEKPTSFRVLGVWSGNLEDFMEGVSFGKQSRILRDGEAGEKGSA